MVTMLPPIPEGIALVRHAVVIDGVVIPSSTEALVKVVEMLRDLSDGRMVEIFHSPQERARVTALRLCDFLIAISVSSVVVCELRWLDTDGRITEGEINCIVKKGKVVVLVSHENSIGDYVGPGHRVGNYSIFARDMKYNGHL